MDLFTISQVSRFAGIKPHTIRIWEQRYNSLKPERSEGNTRYYSNAQLRRLLNIVSLAENGYRVSELSPLPDEKIFKLISEQYSNLANKSSFEYFVLQLIGAAVEYDEVQFEKLFSHCVLKYGMKEAYTNIFYPLLLRIGLMWRSGALPPTQEHFITNLLTQKLYTAIDGLPVANSADESWLLFLPEDEFHEIGLLLANYLIRLSGKRVIYLGRNVPLDSLASCLKETKAKNLLLFLVNIDLPEETSAYLKQLNKYSPHGKIYVVANKKLLEDVKLPKGMQHLDSIQSLENIVSEK